MVKRPREDAEELRRALAVAFSGEERAAAFHSVADLEARVLAVEGRRLILRVLGRRTLRGPTQAIGVMVVVEQRPHRILAAGILGRLLHAVNDAPVESAGLLLGGDRNPEAHPGGDGVIEADQTAHPR